MLDPQTLTNELLLEFNYENILREYDFYIIAIPYNPNEKQYYKTIYSEIKCSFNPKARWIRKVQRGHEYILAFEKSKVPKESPFDIKKMGLSELKQIPHKGMLSILLSLMLSKASFFELSNNPYNIFYTHSISPNKTIALQIILKEVNHKVYISLAATNFKKTKENKGECYIEENGILIPYKEEVHKDYILYQKGNFKSRKISIPFLGLDGKSFTQSKTYYMNLIHQDIQTYLSPYLNLEFVTQDLHMYSDGSDKEKQKKKVAMYISNYAQHIGKLHIANLSDDVAFSGALYTQFMQLFEDKLTISVSSALNQNIPQISITKPKAYYMDDTENDPYKDIQKSTVPTQNITLDTNINPTIINVLMKELSLKCELLDYGLFIDHPTITDKISYYHIEDKDNDIFYKATLSGSTISTSHPSQDDQLMLERIMFAIPMGEIAEAVVTVNDKDIMLITKTEIFPLPDFSKLSKIHALSMENFYFSKDEIINCAKEISNYPCSIEILSFSLDSLMTSSGIPSTKLMGLGEKIISRKLKSLLEKKAGRPLRFSVRDKVSKAHYIGMLGISYYRDEDTILYHGGLASGNLQSSVEKNSPYRRIRAISGEINLDSILPFLEEYFVKYNELTVFPYPLKYAREGYKLSSLK